MGSPRNKHKLKSAMEHFTCINNSEIKLNFPESPINIFLFKNWYLVFCTSAGISHAPFLPLVWSCNQTITACIVCKSLALHGPMQQPQARGGYGASEMWPVWTERYCMSNIHTRFQRLSTKRISISLKFLFWLHVEMVVFWVYWIKYNIVPKLFSPVDFYLLHGATRKFKITYVAHTAFVLDSAALHSSWGRLFFPAIWTEGIFHTSEIAHQQNHKMTLSWGHLLSYWYNAVI